MKFIILMSLVVFTGCAHVASTSGTFSRQAVGSVGLKLQRHMDTIVNGPDVEEDQTLTLTVRNYALHKRLVIPSDDVDAELTITRFGPTTTGRKFQGFLIINSESTDEVVAYLNLQVDARTESGHYEQTVKFKGDYQFLKSHE